MEFGKETAGLSVGRIDAFLWPRSIQNLRKNGEKLEDLILLFPAAI